MFRSLVSSLILFSFLLSIQLQTKLTEAEQRINTLSARELSEDDAEKVQLHQKSQKRLEQVEQELAELKVKLKETRENWAKARGDADSALKAIDDIQAKQKKRWAELTGAGDPSENTDEVDLPIHIEAVQQAQKIIELDHKLKQALENVRQADAVRQNLKEALAMNSSLQGKLDEVKGKYAALQAGRSNSASTAAAKASAEAAATNHGSSEKSRERPEKSESSSKSEKLHREHRRMRKELAAVSASKDAAKAKLEVSSLIIRSYCLLLTLKLNVWIRFFNKASGEGTRSAYRNQCASSEAKRRERRHECKVLIDNSPLEEFDGAT